MINKILSASWFVTLAAVIAGFFAYIFYPGFMSYDSLHAYEGAVHGVQDSAWPPMVSYVWRVVNLVNPDPVLMFFLQLTLFFASCLYISFALIKSKFYALFTLIIILCLPSLLGSIVVIWKDVLMAAFLLASFSFIIKADTVISVPLKYLLFVSSFALLFFGVATRHNAVFAVIPIAFYGSFLLSKHLKLRRVLSTSLMISVLAISVLYLGKRSLDIYSLPSLARLEDKSSMFIDSVRVLDLAAASLCLEENLLKNISNIDSLDDIRSGYDVRHVNNSDRVLSRVDFKRDISSEWVTQLIRHPVCMLENKIGLFYYLAGFNSGMQFIVTHLGVDENEFGIVQSESVVRNVIVKYITENSAVVFVKPWFFILFSMLAVIISSTLRLLDARYYILLASAVFYAGGLVVFGNAADARLLFYSNAVFVLILLSCLKKLYTNSRGDIK